MERVIAPKAIKLGLWRCLKAGVNPEFPEQGTPQGGVCSPWLANIALNGIENIHQSVRYADDMVLILKPFDDAEKILKEIEEFLANRGLKVKESKTKLVKSTDGFDFLGWHFKVQQNGKFRCVPSENNYKTFTSYWWEPQQLEAKKPNSGSWKLSPLHPHGQGWESLICREPDAVKIARPDLNERGGAS